MADVALIVAAGRGTRMGEGLPKQYRPVGGKALLTHTIEALLAAGRLEQVLVVIHEEDRALYDAAVADIPPAQLLPAVHGAATRAGSVRNGLEALADLAPRHVYIHDAARPFISPATVERLAEALDAHEGAFPAVPVADALWRKSDLAPVARGDLVRAQTPQAFAYDKIRAAHRDGDPEALDDVQIARSAGLSMACVPGEEQNFKVTTPDDFMRAEGILAQGPDIRVGQGYDVHAFTRGAHVTLNGIDIPHSRRLKGHSDADVAMHAITDAIYGALAEGDIGTWFPPSEAEWKGAASDIFLAHAAERVRLRGFRISHIDSTIICETPKIGPHASAMRTRLGQIMGLETARISVKATTSEKLGFTGREEGIAAMATATLVRP